MNPPIRMNMRGCRINAWHVLSLESTEPMARATLAFHG